MKVSRNDLTNGKIYVRQTTTTINGKQCFHSVDDKPCLIIATIPIDEIPTPYKGWIDNDFTTDPVILMAWAQFGVVHRDNNFAFLYVHDGSNISYMRIWVTNGIIRTSDFAIQDIFCSYSGNLQDRTIWCLPKPVTICDPLGDLNNLVCRSLVKIDNINGILIDPWPHNKSRPAIITICRDSEERETQPEEAGDINDNEWWYGGIYVPKNRYYLDGEPMSSREHAKLTSIK
jgi:hypothetical protein